ncbi:hypothetical protein ABPG74_001292 [Tetrahymena malaccensis]
MKYHKPSDKIVIINSSSILLTDPYTFNTLKMISGNILNKLQVIEGTNYVIVSLQQYQCWVVDVIQQVQVINMSNSQYLPANKAILQHDTQFYTLSTGQTVIIISNDQGLISWTINLTNFTYVWNGNISNSLVKNSGDQYRSFTKHPNKDILFIVGAYQQILVVQIIDISLDLSNQASSYFLNIYYFVLGIQESFITQSNNILYQFNIQFTSDFSSLTISQFKQVKINQYQDWTPNKQLNSIFISSYYFITVYNYQTQQISRIFDCYGYYYNKRYMIQQQGQTDKYVLLYGNEVRLYERGKDSLSDYILTFPIYPLSQADKAIDIKAKYGINWANLSCFIEPFFFNNTVWVALPLAIKPVVQNFIVQLINCQSGEIFNLTSNQTDATQIYSTYVLASLDDPDNQELIAVDWKGNYFTWDLGKPKFPFKFTTFISCKNIYMADLFYYKKTKRIIASCGDSKIYSIDYVGATKKEIVTLASYTMALKAVSRLQLVLIGDFVTGAGYVFKYDPIQDQFNIFLQFQPTKTYDNLVYVDLLDDNTLWLQYFSSNVFYNITDCLSDNQLCLKCTQQYYFNNTNQIDNSGFYGSGQINSSFTTSQNIFTSMVKAQFYQNTLFNVSNVNVKITVSPENQFILNPNLMNFNFNNIISLNFESQKIGNQAIIQYSSILQFQNYYFIGFKDIVFSFDLSQDVNCGLNLQSINQGVILDNVSFNSIGKPSITKSCHSIVSVSSELTLQNYVISNEDFTNNQYFISTLNINKIYFYNFTLIGCTFGNNFSILKQEQNIQALINNLQLISNKCTNLNDTNDSTSFLFAAGLFQLNGLVMSNNTFCRKAIFSTVVSLDQQNKTFIFNNIYAQNNTFQVRTTYIFFNALYSLLISSNHVLLLQNSLFSNNKLQAISNVDLKIAQYFETVKIGNIIINNVTIQNHFDIQLGYLQNANQISITNFNCSNDQTYYDNSPEQLTASCIQMYEVLQVNIFQLNAHRKKQKDSSLVFLKNFFIQQASLSMIQINFSDLELMQSNLNTQVSPIFIQSSYQIDVTLDQSVFENIYLQAIQNSLSYSSLAIQLINQVGTFTIQNSEFLNSYSQSIYGFVYAQTNTLIVNFTKFSNQTFYSRQQQQLFYQQGGFINTQIQNLNISNSNFSQSTASQGGFLYLNSFGDQFEININNTIFNEGYATLDGGAIFINTKNNQIKLNCFNCQFDNIYTLFSQGSTIGQQQYSQISMNIQHQITFQGGFIKNVKGIQDNYFIDVLNTNLQFLGINKFLSESFNSNSSPHQQYILQSNYHQQALLSNLKNSTLLIQNCNISNLNQTPYYNNNPLLINSIASNVTLVNITVQNVSFISNVIQSASSIIQLQQVTFRDIQQLNVKNRFIKQQNYPIPSSNGVSLISTSHSSLTIGQNSIFKNISCNQNCNGGAIQIISGTINIQFSIFSQIQSSFGGAIFIYGLSESNIIFNNTFISCQSQNDGGAIYFNALQTDVFKLSIDQSQFQNNICSMRGGAIFVNSDIQNSVTQVVQITNSKIIYNQAAVAGGLFYQNILVDYNLGNLISANQATIYGKNSISYPSKLILVNYDSFLQINNGKVSETQIQIQNFRSGGNLSNLEFVLINDQNEVFKPITIEDQNSFSIKVNFSPSTKSLNSYSIEGDAYSFYNESLQAFRFDNIILSGIPGSSASLEFTSDQILTIDSQNKQFVKGYSFNIIIHFRLCTQGEQIAQIDQVVQCQICPLNYYSLISYLKERILQKLSTKFGYFKKFLRSQDSQNKKIKPEIKQKFQQILMKLLVLRPEQKKLLYLKYVEKQYDESIKRNQENKIESLQNIKKSSEEKQQDMKVSIQLQNTNTQFKQNYETQQLQFDQETQKGHDKMKDSNNFIRFKSQTLSSIQENNDEKTNKDQSFLDTERYFLQIKPTKTLTQIDFQSQKNQSSSNNIEINSIKLNFQDQQEEIKSEQIELITLSPDQENNLLQNNNMFKQDIKVSNFVTTLVNENQKEAYDSQKS